MTAVPTAPTPPRVPLPPRLVSADRLGLTLFLAAALHTMLILGVSFAPPGKPPQEIPRTMEVILVHSHSETPPEKADYLAQVTARGGGEMEERVRPASPFANPSASSETGNAPQTQPMTAPPPRPQHKTPEVLSAQRPSDFQAQVETTRQLEVPDSLTAADLMPPSQEIAQLSAEILRRKQNYAQMQRHKYITANTQEYVAAAYEEAWRLKVERVGNLNYPDEARRQQLSGDLILDVAINADGSLHSIKVLRPSGQRVLDDGAVRIVRLAAPYAPLPEALRRETDVLHIVRTWQFQSDNSLETR